MLAKKLLWDQLLQPSLRTLGVDVRRYTPGNQWAESVFSFLVDEKNGYGSIASSEVRFLRYCLENKTRSTAQLFQDLFVLWILKEKQGGYFVEFGATDGVTLSNTKLLESSHRWSGILAEPARGWHDKLKVNRRASIDTRCVWAETGKELDFSEASIGELSTISRFVQSDEHAEARTGSPNYPVRTVSLVDLLTEHGAPREIDYMSVDTEGSEFEILRAFDFDRYRISVLSVEHNFTNNRAELFKLLTSKGLVRQFEKFSKWDDWYVSADLVPR